MRITTVLHSFTAMSFLTLLHGSELPLPSFVLPLCDMKVHSQKSETAIGYSVECLGCHDGVLAENAILAASGNETDSDSASRARQVGLNGMRSHPVSIYYIEGRASLKPIATPLRGNWQGVSVISDLLVNGKVECYSCHVIEAQWSNTAALRNRNSISELCYSCHAK